MTCKVNPGDKTFIEYLRPRITELIALSTPVSLIEGIFMLQLPTVTKDETWESLESKVKAAESKVDWQRKSVTLPEDVITMNQAEELRLYELTGKWSWELDTQK